MLRALWSQAPIIAIRTRVAHAASVLTITFASERPQGAVVIGIDKLQTLVMGTSAYV